MPRYGMTWQVAEQIVGKIDIDVWPIVSVTLDDLSLLKSVTDEIHYFCTQVLCLLVY